MRIFLALLVLGFAMPALADSFGQRFGNEPPMALPDTLDPTTVIYIEPAAGEEEEAEAGTDAEAAAAEEETQTPEEPAPEAE